MVFGLSAHGFRLPLHGRVGQNIEPRGTPDNLHYDERTLKRDSATLGEKQAGGAANAFIRNIAGGPGRPLRAC